jgi:hypothetical protein
VIARVLGLAGDLVDLVDVDDPGLGLLDVVVGGLDELEEDVLDVLADVAGLGQRRRVGDGERDVEHLGEGLGEVGLAAAGRADQQDVGLGDVDVVLVLLAQAAPRPGCACSGCRPRRRAPSWRSWPTMIGLEEVEDLTRLGQLVEPSSLDSASSSSMISLHRSMHSSQM